MSEQSDHSADVFQVSGHPEPGLIAKLSWGREMDGGHLVCLRLFSEVLISKPNLVSRLFSLSRLPGANG